MLDDFLTKDECKQMISYYFQNPNKTDWNKKGPNNRVFMIGEDNPRNHPLVIYVWDKMNAAVRHMGLRIHWSQIYEWFPDSRMGKHIDTVHPDTVYTSVLYLNDDFEGGETFFGDGSRFAPRTGRIVFYDGVEHPHGVLRVKNKKRYVCAAWYKEL